MAGDGDGDGDSDASARSGARGTNGVDPPSTRYFSTSVGFNTSQDNYTDDDDDDDGAVTASRNTELPHLLHHRDTDDDNIHRPSKRTRSMDGTGGMPMIIRQITILMMEPSGNGLPEMMLGVIAKKFEVFLLNYVSPKNDQHRDFEYLSQINEMVLVNKCSLVIDLKQFLFVHPTIALWIAEAPRPVLEVIEEVANKIVFDLHPNYRRIHQKIYVRVSNLPTNDEMGIDRLKLNTLIRIDGVVTRRSGVFPQLQQVTYDCNRCGAIWGPVFQNSYSEVKVGSCPECESKGPFTVNIEQTTYRGNYQKITLQEIPGNVPASRLPRCMEVILLDDARPGEEIEVTGIYTNNFDLSLSTKNGFPVFAAVIEANYITKKQDLISTYELTQEDKEEIEKLAKDPRIGERIIKSIAPLIYGHEDIKTAIALALFGGHGKNVEGKHRLRGNINVLLLGDPGTAKSQFLKVCWKDWTKAVYTTGKGDSAARLTAAVHKDPVTFEWTLEGGALVLSDRGICLIDEFDKLNDQDRVSIHETMEQQSTSTLEAGIVTSLLARCSVIAAANPIGGRYDSSKAFSQNVELNDPIVSCFDILCVVKDVVDPVTEEMLAPFVVDSHCTSQPKGPNFNDRPVTNSQDEVQLLTRHMDDPEIIPLELLKKYLAYAKLNVFPRLHDADLDKLNQVYAEVRKESSHGQGAPIAVRHIESMTRMSEAHARMHLRQHVTQEDVGMATRVLLHSFISTQKFVVQKALQKDFNGIVSDLLRGLVKDAMHFEEIVSGSDANLSDVDVKVEELQSKAID